LDHFHGTICSPDLNCNSYKWHDLDHFHGQ
jgi:hypothetical protein